MNGSTARCVSRSATSRGCGCCIARPIRARRPHSPKSIRRLHGGFVIGHFGGLLVPVDGDLRDLVAALECPLFLMR